MKAGVLLASSLLAVASAIPTGSLSSTVHEKRASHANTNWIKREAVDPHKRVPVRIALKQQNLEKGEELLLEVSDPKSAKYGQHYSQDQVAELFAPHQKSIDAVKDWLVKSGISAASIKSSKSKQWLDFETTVGQLQSVLQTQYHHYSHATKRGDHIGTDEYSLPNEIADHVDFVHPGVTIVKTTDKAGTKASKTKVAKPVESKIPGPKKLKPIPSQIINKIKGKSANTQYCSSFITPECIKALYNITDGKKSNPSNKLGIYESDDEIIQQSDLDVFFGLFAPDIPASYAPQIDLIDYGKHKPNPKNAEGEDALDFDVAIPIIYPQETVLFQSHDNFGPKNASDPFSDYRLGIFNQFLDAIDGSYATSSSHNETGDDPDVDGITPNEQAGTFKPTNVISFSYGLPESDYPAGYLQRQCSEFLKLGLQGTSIVFSSGDGGVAGGHGYECLGNDDDPSKGHIFNPQAPAGCPYVTSVGATFLPDGSAPGDQEVATTSFGSGGGFSNIWTTPSYQAEAVAAYFSNHNLNYPSYTTSAGKIPKGKGIFNRGGRGYPDIAAVGDNGVTVFDGQVGTSGGTSMSAPIVAAIFTRINEERIAKKKSPIGFANPALYQRPSVFNDIITGDQSGYASGYCNGKGFKAVTGWDPVTGLGTPNYPKLKAYLVGLP